MGFLSALNLGGNSYKLKPGNFYECQSMEQWNALTQEQQDEYDYVLIIGDEEEQDLTNAYLTTDSAVSTINVNDYFPVQKTDGTKKKLLWNTIMNKIKSTLGTAAQKDSTDEVTENSTDLVESGAVYSEVNTVKQALTTETTARTNADADMVNILGAKNLLPITITTGTKNGITYTVGSDGSITLTGTASKDTFLILTDVGNFPTTGNYKLNGSPSDSKNTNHWIWLGTNPGGNGANYNGNNIRSMGANDSIGFDIANLKRGDGSAIDVSVNLVLYLTIKQGSQPNGAVYKPMLRPSNIVDNTFVPYAMSNRELTDNKANMTDLTESSLMFTGTATTNVLKGQHFYNNGVLRRATSAISNGASITNSNSTAVTIGAALTALNVLNGGTATNSAVKRFGSSSLSPQITTNTDSFIILVTNRNWYESNFSLTLFKGTSESGGTIYKSVIAGSDIYSMSKVDNSHYTITDSSGYPGSPLEVVIDIEGSVTAISNQV